MKPNNDPQKRRVGRRPKNDPAIHRYVIYLNSVENAKFLSLFEQSGKAMKSHFITSCIFNKPFKVVKIDKGVQDYYMRLTTFFGQYRMVGTNYNQIVKALKSNFSEKKALVFLYKLEKATLELVALQKQVILLTDEFEQKHEHQWLQK
ncbi:conjugal transfer protein MobA [Dysgonomonas sp. Marseille-P4361]|uniref:conjugal transfer protein MobA n=1 Tax=Dysgonomonas sp. Marseille-P4361 TaxID=2161820 RepID=UPI000D561172|nr:conjugal transfer protein MobA [Dysgonomonas sp. Marseille-P4361]